MPPLTWLANISEQQVASVGSEVILRISCSIGVMPVRGGGGRD